MSAIQLWGGLECTINRVGDAYFDQLAKCGHYGRLDDLDAIAALGVRTLRYPALWERIAPDGIARADWRWCDAALGRLRDLGIEPIVGLVHHGSGPRSTDLLDPGFAAGLAGYAAAFADRYPWVRRYTPINEPLTTARFACLYGHWYPHRRDDRAFVAALLNQCCAIADAMTAIRGRVPDAQLVQTEDAGFVRAGRSLAEQAVFENHRRWLSLDLLTGAADEHHPLWRYLVAHHADRRQLARLHEQPVPPDVIGLNYYATSDRFLDERLDRYPPSMHGGNGRQRYADVEAVRVEGVGLRGHTTVLAEAWRRFSRPVAITEAHLGCTREEQMRWLAEAWYGAHAVAAQGADVRAVAAWALLGLWDWDSLLTRGDTDHYEAGAFDVRTGSPRPTALAGMIEGLAAGREMSHPVLDSPGWWRRTGAAGQASARPLLITGANGRLGRAFARACDARGLHCVALAHRDLDITHPETVRQAIARWRPWAIVNGAGYAGADMAEHEPAVCRRANAVGPAVLAAMCRKARIQLVTFSSDLVFDGQSTRPYIESDPVCPRNTYGRINVEAERRVLAFAPSALVIRAGALFGPFNGGDLISRALDALAAGNTFSATSRALVSPTYVPDLVDRALDLVIDGAAGIWHVANAGAVSWLECVRMAAVAARLNPEAIRDGHTGEPHRAYRVLGSERGVALAPLEDSIQRFVRDRTMVGTAA